MNNSQTYDILKYAVDHNEPSVWIKCLRVLMRLLEKNPNIRRVNDDFDIDEYFTSDDLSEIWKWMLDEYKYQGKYYRSRLLETDYFKNYSLFDDTSKFIQNIPTNTRRSLKYYTGIRKYVVGNKEKQLIKKCLISSYNWIIDSNSAAPTTYELKNIILLWLDAKKRFLKLPPLKQSELNEIFKKTMIPNDISIAIGDYLATIKPPKPVKQTNNETQQAGKRHRKTQKRNKRRQRQKSTRCNRIK